MRLYGEARHTGWSLTPVRPSTTASFKRGSSTAVSHAVEEDSGSQPDTTDYVLRTVVGGTPILYAKMGGAEVQCVVDTGSMVSFVPEAVYKEVLLPQCGKAKDIGNVLTVRGANGLEMLDLEMWRLRGW